MSMDAVEIILLFSTLLLVLLVLVGITAPLWGWHLYKFKRWMSTRNKCLSDYDVHSGPGCLMAPLIDGLIDSDFYWSVDRKCWRYNEIDERLLVVSKLSKKLEHRIENRYNNRAMRNVYGRACKTLLNYRRDRAYYSFDAEFDDMYEKAMELKKDNCLKCDDRGGTWEPPGAASQSFRPCSCKNAKNRLFP